MKTTIQKETSLESTPVIRANQIDSSAYIGEVELRGNVWSIVKIAFGDAEYLVAGSACNAGLLPSYAIEIDYSDDETLQELCARLALDLEEIDSGIPSGNLLEWHGSMVI